MEYLGEHEFAFSDDRLGFPSIAGCRAIVYQTTAGLFGYHNAGGNWARDWPDRSREFADYVRNHVRRDGLGLQLYVTGFTRQPQTGYTGPADWPGEAKAFAKALGFKGPRGGYDLSTSIANGSAYVEYRRVGSSCLLFVNAWDDHNSKNAPPTSGAKADQLDHKMRGTRSAVFVRTDVDKSGLTKVDPVALR
jgi:hypothetical protein